MNENGAQPKTMFEKIWDAHLVQDLGDGYGLIFVDRQLLTELAAPDIDAGGLAAKRVPSVGADRQPCRRGSAAPPP